MKRHVTPEYLLEGAMYALEQCGILLRDALTLYKSGAYASAIVLAAFAREELGRAQIVLALRKRIVEKGESVTVEAVRRECDKHVTKQKWSQISQSLRLSGQEPIARKLANATSPKEREGVLAVIREVMQRMAKRLPDDRHKARKSALYVEANESGWNRPRDQSRDAARVFIEDAVGDYALEYDRYQSAMAIQYQDEELFRALQSCRGCPELPRYDWPEP